MTSAMTKSITSKSLLGGKTEREQPREGPQCNASATIAVSASSESEDLSFFDQAEARRSAQENARTKCAEEIVRHLKDAGLLESIEGCDDETCRVFLPIKHILSNHYN